MSIENHMQQSSTDPILGIIEEVFTALIDGEPGYVRPWEGGTRDLTDPVSAWVEVHGLTNSRVILTSEHTTATSITRSLLAMGDNEEVGTEDFCDALGEVANVVGGNVKSLLPESGALTLPVVAGDAPDVTGSALLYELALDWRGHLLVIGLWSLT